MVLVRVQRSTFGLMRGIWIHLSVTTVTYHRDALDSSAIRRRVEGHNELQAMPTPWTFLMIDLGPWKR